MRDKQFFIRFAVTTAAVILVMYLAKIWFVDPRYTGMLSQGRTAGQVIVWQDAGKYYGKNVIVEGTIVGSYNSGKVCFLNFHPDYKHHFTVVIFASAFPRFPANPENYYMGKKIRVSGYIKEYQGKPEIILNDPGQIEVLN